MDSIFLSAVYALSAAGAWGSGDFTGGLVARRIGPFHAVLTSYSIGMVLLVIIALGIQEKFPSSIDLAWGALAGLFGMAGLGFLLQGFTAGRMGIVAPVSAVLAAAIPVIFSAFTEGLPREMQLLGFGLALVSIWLLSRPDPLRGRPAGLGMALLAGLGFGGFFTILGQIEHGSLFWPLVSGRVATCAVMVAFALSTRRALLPPNVPVRLVTLAGIFDSAGNLFFLMAIQSGRLDVASVLGSLYPAVTAILAAVIAREHIARLQVFGVAMAVLAIVLITK